MHFCISLNPTKEVDPFNMAKTDVSEIVAFLWAI
jgi:hypothetical protein